MPGAAQMPDQPQIEVKVESYLQNAKKLYVDIQMTWLAQASAQTLDPEPMLRECERFAAGEVVAFIRGERI